MSQIAFPQYFTLENSVSNFLQKRFFFSVIVIGAKFGGLTPKVALLEGSQVALVCSLQCLELGVWASGSSVSWNPMGSVGGRVPAQN